MNTNEKLVSFLTDQVQKHHLHPISVHIPNGALPLSVAFVALAVLFDIRVLDQAAFFNMIFIVLTLPVVLLTGYVEWKNRYGGNMTKVFKRKIFSGGVVSVLSVLVILWHLIDPEVTTAASGSRWMYLLVHLVILAAAGIAGYYGGKLVFQARDNALRRKTKPASPAQPKAAPPQKS